MNYETIKYEIKDKILTITLNRPDRLNAFTGQMMNDLISAFDSASKDDEVRVIIVTGEGRGFCAGADLGAGEATFNRDKNPRAEKTQDEDNLEWLRDGGGRTTLAIYDCSKPIIAAINGKIVSVEFFDTQKNIQNINCYSNEGDKWEKSKVSFKNNILSIKFREAFIPRRGRINCSLNDDGKWRWFGTQFIISKN